MATVRIPPVLRPSVGGEREVEAEGATVGEVLTALVEAHPETREQIFAEDGELNRYVNVYLNDEDVRVLDSRPWPAAAPERRPVPLDSVRTPRYPE
jgi:sulfur-carrier protein